jgi:ribonuclease BN (tRNA processing enzyme)
MRITALGVAFVSVLLAPPAADRPQPAPRTKVLMLGTGTPIPDPDRSGPAVVVVVDTFAYLFDAGPGVMRRASAAGKAGLAMWAPSGFRGQPNPRFDAIFITHLHSDHTMGLADAIFTPWIQGRSAPVDVYGPPGVSVLVESILAGNMEDIRERVASPAGPSADGWRARPREVGPGEVFRDARITVRAFRVPHSEWPNAYGYRIDTPDRSIVISGDTRESDAVANACNGCDVLIHEVYSDSGLKLVPPARQPYHTGAHTPATGAGRVATKGRAKLLVLTHLLFFGAPDAVMLREATSTFAGRVVIAKDLDTY